MVYLLLLHDEPIEILSAWETLADAEAEKQRILDETLAFGPERIDDFYWTLNRLAIQPMHIQTKA